LNRLGDSRTGDGFSLTKPVRPHQLRELLQRVFLEHRGPVNVVPATPPNSRPAANCEPLKLTVLLVEDDRINQLMAEGILEKLGCQVVIVDNGYAAIDAATSRHFDVILMDCQMPGIDGLEATARIRMAEHKLARTPTRIVAVTANAMLGDREICLTASMDDYLAKPFSLEQMRAILLANSGPARGTVVPSRHDEPPLLATGTHTD
jgi:CheY-like chemotaxis protein